MANVVVTLKLMPESPEVDLSKIEIEAKKRIHKIVGPGDMKIEQEPIAFGLKAIKIMFIMNEAMGNTEPIEDAVANIDGVQSVEITDVRRAVG